MLSVDKHKVRQSFKQAGKLGVVVDKATIVNFTFEPGKFTADQLLLLTSESVTRPDFLKALQRAQAVKFTPKRFHYVKMSASLTASMSLTFSPR